MCDFRVVDESGDWVVVDKPAPLIVHPANGREEPSLLGGLRALLACDLADGGGLSILTRLDRETSGLVLVTKSRRAAREFAARFERREVEKGYRAVVHGWPGWEAIDCRAPIRRAGEVGESPIWLRQRTHPDGRPSETAFAVVRRFERDGRFALVDCRPGSGRTHQIRVHLEALGHPLVGDKIYGTDGRPYLEQISGRLSETSRRALRLPRHALHAARLAVRYGDRRLAWESPLPEDLTRFVSGDSLPVSAHGQPD